MIPSYTIIYSSRKTISIRIKKDQSLIVSAPYFTSKKFIKSFIQEKEQWILQSLEKIKGYQIPLKENIDKSMKDLALIQILPRIEYYASKMDLLNKYKTIKITSANTKRGSCSKTGSLMFHRKLSKFPLFVLDYVIVHELAHLIHFNHSKDFRNLVAEFYPDYKKTKKRLKDNGNIYKD